MADKDTTEETVVLEQFKRNLDHIQIDTKKLGPEITVGPYVLRFKARPPVTALGTLVANENRVDGMTGYISKCLLDGQQEQFEELLEQIDIEGLGEILNILGEGYTSFPEKS